VPKPRAFLCPHPELRHTYSKRSNGGWGGIFQTVTLLSEPTPITMFSFNYVTTAHCWGYYAGAQRQVMLTVSRIK